MIVVLLTCPVSVASGADGALDSPAHWALSELVRPPVPVLADAPPVGNPIDAFVLAMLKRHGLGLSHPADRRQLIRRATIDVTGLPPTPEEVEVFVCDSRPDAFVTVVDRLLNSPHYGERWARHWMDVVQFAETHGHDEDAIREHAWPYRDYLIASFNSDKPYGRFVMEQVAGDVLFPDNPQAIVATGFLAAGPWDASSQMGIQDDTLDKKVAQYLDRDDMLTTTMATFNSLTVQCARCHDHKFDPITLEDYYSLQAVFAGVDRVDRPYDPDPGLHRRRRALRQEIRLLERGELPARYQEQTGWRSALALWEEEATQPVRQWQVLDPDTVQSQEGAAPVIQEDGSIFFGGPRPERDTYLISARTTLPRITAIRLEVLTDERLPHSGPGRQDNGNLHLSELILRTGPVGDSTGLTTVELHPQPVADFNQEGWSIDMALDGDPETAWGIYPAVGQSHQAVFTLQRPLRAAGAVVLQLELQQRHGGGHLIGRPRLSVTAAAHPILPGLLPESVRTVLATPPEERTAEAQRDLACYFLLTRARQSLESLPRPSSVYAVSTDFDAQGNFKPARGPRPVHVLRRGDVLQPGDPAQPGALSCLAGMEARFDLPADAEEGARRARLAQWLASPENPLTWRSMANRVWQHHFGRGIVATPNDFGTMGAAPTHPELLDWLACELRDHGGSLKHLHKLMMTSTTYRQSSEPRPEAAAVDPDNLWLWRAPLRRLDAEALRDAILHVSGALDLRMGGPSARQFNLSKGVHVTPNIDYLGFDPADPANHRRSVYRFVFRTLPDPFMQAFDCPDASQRTGRRVESVTPQQALALLHNAFVIRQSKLLADRLRRERPTLRGQITRLFELAFARNALPAELEDVGAYADRHGLANACRMVFNSNEFVFVP